MIFVGNFFASSKLGTLASYTKMQIEKEVLEILTVHTGRNLLLLTAIQVSLNFNMNH